MYLIRCWSSEDETSLRLTKKVNQAHTKGSGVACRSAERVEVLPQSHTRGPEERRTWEVGNVFPDVTSHREIRCAAAANQEGQTMISPRVKSAEGEAPLPSNQIRGEWQIRTVFSRTMSTNCALHYLQLRGRNTIQLRREGEISHEQNSSPRDACCL